MKSIHFYSILAVLALGALPTLAACDDDDSDGTPAAGTGGAAGKAGSGGTAGDGAAGSGGAGSGGAGGGGAGSGGAGSGGAAGTSGGGQGGVAGSGGSGSLFQAGGKTGGAPVPASAKLVVLWGVSSGSPDYSYAFGGGTSTGATFVTEFGADPPAEAINSYGVGVGMVIALKPGFVLPEGKVELSQDEVDANALGATPSHAVIWRAAGKPVSDWSGAFPAGYSCGRCVAAAPDDIFDSYEPAACSDLELVFTDDLESLDYCNWT